MSRQRDGARFVTPEAVEVELDSAGLGSRFVAMAVDALILGVTTAVAAVAVLAGTGVAGDELVGIVLLSALVLFVTVGYFALFEGLWDGRTPGKRATGIRVIQDDGRPVTGASVLVRNLLRLVDLLPVAYAVGVVSILVTRRSQRLGDLAAGTIVVHDRRDAAPEPLAGPAGGAAGWAAHLDTAEVTDRDVAVIRSFLQRREGLDAAARGRIAGRIAGTVRERVRGVPAGVGDEDLLEAVVAAVRDRGAGGRSA